ncbi:peptidyl-prolyl cis-trans isomerase B [Campylobacter pinnipediorum subsp. caledonicus]|uniref:Peptidyl-prolyl cis-trans isomerase n=1 Tax=Campylobacter pinnipediorum subsp. caledonicus TaxID=1874362 RepID=A0A1S6U7K4_9BACT|nr:peptidylprolyl isomerase [Campylobacter pinnipediorum]AQW84473.1 peptidyl-prolyl cis-trans isomerase B [Campylobacter pinnipediorum subsp. pinnipediorum]AQW86085.1 peptidyl-prolyl cis-trans isomerase B [Campylobacter pinnipediorum subsp. caledonicus]AQW87693.1 peptidyl-prolyl cis-trans isomerase B [Campylobacter pinnipediorum subsp. caledonicus]OPA72178.1 peptidylprolyl isomerase [Campylobacter pinnipediorum subsp. caledonicus]OPA78120.1 peptidylprolyl isomerase [Campylobacter pinnipediorum
MREELKVYDINLDELKKNEFAVLHTEKGDIKLELFHEEAPQAVMNFVSLINSGFYNGLNFHRVIKNFVIQGGCPHGNGMGGPGYRIKCECDNQNVRHERGSLSMAHAGRDTGGSQFFICHSAQPHLDGVHTVFGKCADNESLKVLDSIEAMNKIVSAEILSK